MFPVLDNGPVRHLDLLQPGDDRLINDHARAASTRAGGPTSFYADRHVRRNGRLEIGGSPRLDDREPKDGVSPAKGQTRIVPCARIRL